MQKISGIIFDLDGTVANTLPLCIRAFKEAIEPLINRSLSDEEIIATFGPSEEGTIMALAPDHYEQGVADYLDHYQKLHHMCPAPFDGVPELLKRLKEDRVRIGMVTGKGPHSTEISLRQFGIKDEFECIETGNPYGPKKPKGIKAVIRKFNPVVKEEIVYIGDHPSDISSSREAGIAVVAAAWAETAEADKLIRLGPDAIFYDIPQFTAWLYSRI